MFSRKKIGQFVCFSVIQFSLLITLNANACSAVFWNDNAQAKAVARSMDFYRDDQPHLVVYPRGITRSGDAGANSVHWTAQYGSVAITALNSNSSSDGINEQGLGAQLLYLYKTEYETKNPKLPALSNLLWAQYMLDNFATVKEAIDHIHDFQLVSMKLVGKEWPVHLILQDKTGDAAVIEYINGKMVIHHGPQYQVVTNEPAYDLQLANLKHYKLFGGNLAMPGDIDPMSRFVRAASYLKTLPTPETYTQAIAGVLSVIRTTMVPFGAQNTSTGEHEDTWPTRWITLKDLSHRLFYFSSTSAPNIIWVDFKNLNFKEGAPLLGLDPRDQSLSGDVSAKLKAYTPPAH